ncbi:MAG: glycosyltransferase [Candidatus Paceibacterota bacterium]|jgi:glycosyltransferase involved in cell wall biosynthesis
MKLLITTQAVDARDSDLGFFVRWIEEFAKQCEKVTVICLREGEHSLPSNVAILTLGNASRLSRTMSLWRICISRRHEYDAVFVHMNPEYLIAAGLLWRLMHKRIALWYTHKSVNLKLRIAVLFAHTVFTASAESFRLRSKKVRVMGHGIDTDFFSPPTLAVGAPTSGGVGADPSITRGTWALSVGRLMPSKRHDLAIRRARGKGIELHIVGEGPERQNLEALAREPGESVTFLGGLSHERVRDEYRRAAYLLHTSETGSLDKVVLEALACGLPIRTNDPALKHLESASPEYVREHHSLSALVPRIIQALQTV